jgi:hypothetical protein
MRILLICLLLTGCAGTKWESFDYGPGEWLAEQYPSLTDGKGLEINTSNYAKLLNPEIRIHVVDDLTEVCGTIANGCAIGTAEFCDIYIGERASQNTINHEKRHCYGWSHRPGPKQEGEITHWYPINQLARQE